MGKAEEAVAAPHPPAPSIPRPPSPGPNRGRWRWVAFFVVLAGLAATAIALPIVYNLGQQLRPEQLAVAQRLWHDHGPRDYDLTFSIRYDDDKQPERHVVLVRDGGVVFASCEGEVRHLSLGMAGLAGFPAGGALRGQALDVPGILAHVERLVEERGQSGGRDYLVATFHGEDGHPRRIIRRVRGTRTREEWDVRVWPAGALERGPGGGR